MTRVLRLLAALACMVALSACDICDVEITAQADSPDRSLTATWWTANCGATTDYISQINVHPKSVNYRKNGTAVFGMEGKRSISIRWIDQRTLSIRCSDCESTRIKWQDTRSGDVTIVYDFGPAAGKR